MEFSLRWEWAGHSVQTNGKRPKIRYGEVLPLRHEEKITYGDVTSRVVVQYGFPPGCSLVFWYGKVPWLPCASLRAHTVLKSPWILGEVHEKSLNSMFRWKVLKFLCKSLKSPWIFFNFECSGLESVFWCFLVVQDRIWIIAQRI